MSVAALRVGPLSIRTPGRPLVVTLALLVALLLASLATICLGVNTVPLPDALAAIAGTGSPAAELIVGGIRLPRVLTAALVGIALGMAGALFQTVTRNPLGSPDVIGFETGASTGAIVAILVVRGGVAGTAIGAVLGGVATALLVLLLTARGGFSPLRLILVGIGTGAFLAAVNSSLIVRAQLYDAQSAAVWLVGNLAGRDWSDVALMAPVVAVAMLLAAPVQRPLALAEFSDERSAGLGSHPGRTRLGAVALGVLLCSAAVASAGPVPFVALAAPQIARRLTRTSGPGLVSAGVTGGLLLVVADFAAREALQPRLLPVGVITGMIGGLYLIWLLSSEWRRGRG